MINILHSIDTSGPGGAETVFINLIENINPNKFRSIAVISGKGWLYEQLNKKGITTYVVDVRGSFNFNYLWHLFRIVKKHKINIIHSHLFGSNVYCSLIGFLCGIPVISNFHGFVDADCKENLTKIKFKLIRLGSIKIVFVSNKLRDYFILNTLVNPEMTNVIYNGIDTNRFKPKKSFQLRKELEIKKSDILIGAIGNIRKAKGYEYLLATAVRIKKLREDIKFVIVGDRSSDLYGKLIKMRDELDLENTVFFIGFRHEPEKILNNLDMFLLTSTSEGFSISLIEAMACEIPVIATISGGPEEIIENNKDGLLVDKRSFESIAHAIIEVQNNHKLLEDLGKNARTKVLNNFSLERMVNSYDKIYLELIDKI